MGLPRRGPSRLAAARPGRRGPRHRGARPRLLPLDLLPRAGRRAVRDRHPLPRLCGRRGSRPSRRRAPVAADARASAPPARADPDAADQSTHLVSELHHLERPADGTPEGLLVLHHGRGADEHDLLPLADILDPNRRLHVVTPQGPLTLPGAPGRHWYVVPRVGYPEPASFRASLDALVALHAELGARLGLGPDRTILGGFSQGTVMSYAAGLGAGLPAPAGILALSGFIPTVPDWTADLSDRTDLRVFIAHGTRDGVIGVDFARDARERLRAGGIEPDYHQFE